MLKSKKKVEAAAEGKRGTQLWKNLVAQNQRLTVLAFFLLISNVALVIRVATFEQQTILIPPNLDEKTKVTLNNADATFKKTWATFVANLVGNINPVNADTVKEQISFILDPKVQGSFMRAMNSRVEKIKLTRALTTFEPVRVAFSDVRNIVWVMGNYRISMPSGKVKTEQRTFEIFIEVENGHPIVRNFKVYKGAPNTNISEEEMEEFRVTGELRYEAEADKGVYEK
jgi:type IV conjugative transfer system protein TraE